MAGVPSVQKRAKVRKFLRTRRGQTLSDREAARECECGRQLVKAVRVELIAAGMHPAVTHCPWRGEGFAAYRPGAAARGGYVFDDQGRIIRETEWARRQRGAARAERPA